MKRRKVTRAEIDAVLARPYSRAFVPEADGRFSAWVVEFPGCFTCGDTLQETWDYLAEAMHNWVEACLSMGQEIPEPREAADVHRSAGLVRRTVSGTVAVAKNQGDVKAIAKEFREFAVEHQRKVGYPLPSATKAPGPARRPRRRP